MKCLMFIFTNLPNDRLCGHFNKDFESQLKRWKNNLKTSVFFFSPELICITQVIASHYFFRVLDFSHTSSPSFQSHSPTRHALWWPFFCRVFLPSRHWQHNRRAFPHTKWCAHQVNCTIFPSGDCKNHKLNCLWTRAVIRYSNLFY